MTQKRWFVQEMLFRVLCGVCVDMVIVCLWYIYPMFILYLLYVYSIFILCLSYIYGIFIVCLWYVVGRERVWSRVQGVVERKIYMRL